MQERKNREMFDIIIFGATGFTGRWIVRRIANHVKNQHIQTYAIAGRSASRLNEIQEELQQLQLPLPSSILICDVQDKSSLETVTKQGKLLINCVGPFRLYGLSVVEACISSGCHYIDISGEPYFLELVEQKLHEEAKKANTIIVGSAAFDTVPADFGSAYTAEIMRKANYLPTSIIGYLSLQSKGSEGIGGHFATYESAVLGLGGTSELISLRKKASLKPVSNYGGILSYVTPDAKQTQDARSTVFWSREINAWCIPFMGADASVVRRTQRTIENRGLIPFNFSAFVSLPSTWSMIQMLFYGSIFNFLAKFKWGRWLLLKYPRFFTNNVFSHEGPSNAQIAATSFLYRFVGLGYTTNDIPTILKSPIDRKAKENISTLPPANVRTTVIMQGTEPGYDATSSIVSAYAVTMLHEKDSLPISGGVYTPAAVIAPGTSAGNYFLNLAKDSIRIIVEEEPHIVEIKKKEGDQQHLLEKKI